MSRLPSPCHDHVPHGIALATPVKASHGHGCSAVRPGRRPGGRTASVLALSRPTRIPSPTSAGSVSRTSQVRLGGPADSQAQASWPPTAPSIYRAPVRPGPGTRTEGAAPAGPGLQVSSGRLDSVRVGEVGVRLMARTRRDPARLDALGPCRPGGPAARRPAPTTALAPAGTSAWVVIPGPFPALCRFNLSRRLGDSPCTARAPAESSPGPQLVRVHDLMPVTRTQPPPPRAAAVLDSHRLPGLPARAGRGRRRCSSPPGAGRENDASLPTRPGTPGLGSPGPPLRRPCFGPNHSTRGPAQPLAVETGPARLSRPDGLSPGGLGRQLGRVARYA